MQAFEEIKLLNHFNSVLREIAAQAKARLKACIFRVNFQKDFAKGGGGLACSILDSAQCKNYIVNYRTIMLNQARVSFALQPYV